MIEQTNEKEKVTTIQLEIRQFEHLLVAFGSIARELNSIAFKIKELKGLENSLTRIEGELKLLRMEISELKEKIKK